MQALDIRTLFALLALVNLLLCLALALFWRTQKTYPGFGLWVACNAGQAIFYALFTMRDVIPDFWSVVVAYALTTLAMVLRLEGIKRFLGAKRLWLPNFLAPLVVFLLLAFFTFGQDSVFARNLIVTLSLTLILGRSAWLLIVHAERQTRQLFWTLAAIQLVRASVLIARVVAGIVSPANLPLFSQTPANVGSILVIVIVDIALTISYLMLNSQRLAIDLTIAQRKAEENSRRLSDIIDFLPDATFAIDQGGRIVAWNRAMETTTGVPAAEMIGQGDHAYALPFYAERRPMLIALTLPAHNQGADGYAVQQQSGQVLVAEIMARPQGKPAWFWEKASPLFDVDGTCAGAIESLRDITERKLAEEERERLIRELDAFAHTVAHDLKSPLTVITAYAEMLSGENAPDNNMLSAEQRQGLSDAIFRGARKLNRIIEELLLLAQVRGVGVERLPVDMRQIVDEACQRLAGEIQQHAAEITVPATWPEALGYGPWIEEVWVNYLSNALKYGGRPPHIALGAAAQPDGAVRFWIRDNGPGLSPEEQARLFTPFTRLSQTRAEGQGLGLSIVRRIVEKLDGQVGVASPGVSDEGCTFFFTLPAAAGTQQSGLSEKLALPGK
ncbi:MAG: PAS domain-containing sensor histidine kinase [Chloroflexi bacterium]|nr:PAS domain-containing sensor histidine kinase [Chloroflexota bacterium]